MLHCDHIEPLSFLVTKHNIKTMEDARNCSALWDINNGRILCETCHRNTDTYGLGKRNAAHFSV